MMRTKYFALVLAAAAIAAGGVWLLVDGAAAKAEDDGKTYLGVYIGEVTEGWAERYELGDHEGVLVRGVSHGSPADEAGLQRGDLIVAVDGQAVATPDQLTEIIQRHEPGDRIAVELIRHGQSQTLHATLAEREERTVTARFVTPRIRARTVTPRITEPLRVVTGPAWLGINYQDLSPELGEYFDRPDGGGVLVVEVDEESPAEKAGIRVGDVIIQAGGKEVATGRELRQAIWGHETEEPFEIVLLRHGQQMTVTAELERRGRLGHPAFFVSPDANVSILEDFDRQIEILEDLDIGDIAIDVPEIDIDFHTELAPIFEDLVLPHMEGLVFTGPTSFSITVDEDGEVEFNGRHFDSVDELKEYLQSDEYKQEMERKHEEMLQEIESKVRRTRERPTFLEEI